VATLVDAISHSNDAGKNGNHPSEELAKYGYRPDMDYKSIFIHPSIYIHPSIHPWATHTENQIKNSGDFYFLFFPHIWQ
jgi:hypothetical protein